MKRQGSACAAPMLTATVQCRPAMCIRDRVRVPASPIDGEDA